MIRDVARRNLVGMALFAGVVALVATPASAQRQVEMPAQDRPINMTLESMYEVGAFGGADWENFGEVTGLAFGPDGNLYVLDGMSFRVVVISPAGDLVRTFGRQGQGPGEFQMPGGITVLEDGTVAVYDRAVRNFTFLEPDGTYIRSVPTSMLEDGISMGRLAAGGGVTVSEFRGLDVDTGTPETDPKNGDKLFIREIGNSGVGAVRAAMTRPGNRATFTSTPNEQNISIGGGEPAFAPRIDWELLPDGRLAWIDQAAYSVNVGGPGGTEVVFTRPIQPRVTTARDQTAEKDRRLTALEATGAGAPLMIEMENGVRRSRRDTEMGRRMIEALEFADVIPTIEAIAVDQMGRIWAHRTGAAVGESGPVDLIDPSRGYLGSFELDALPSAVSAQGYAAFIEFGEFGVQTVRVAQIRGG